MIAYRTCLNVRSVTDLRFKLPVIIPEYSRIAELTYTGVIPLMMQFLVLKCVSTYTRVYTVFYNKTTDYFQRE